MKKNLSGFSLIELLIVIAIVGILVAVALPHYQGYMVRAKLVEVENTMANVKSAVSAYHHDTETWPNCPSITEIRNSLGVGVGAVETIQSMSIDPGTGEITAIVQKVNALVDGETLILIPTVPLDGSISWRWDFSANFPVHLRPRH